MSLTALIKKKCKSITYFFHQFLSIDATVPTDFRFTRNEIAMFHQLAPESGSLGIDDQSWDDLLLNQYSDELSSEVSIFGQQILHHRLRNEVSHGGIQVRHLIQDSLLQSELHLLCQPLRDAECEVSSVLFGAPIMAPPLWSKYLWALSFGFFLSLVLATITNFAWIGVGISLFSLIAIQTRFYARIQMWDFQIRSVQRMLGSYARLGSCAEKKNDPALTPFRIELAQLNKINRILTPSKLINAIPGASAYCDWFLLKNVRQYFIGLRTVNFHRKLLRECYLRIANLDADLAVARHLQSVPTFCWADIDLETNINFEGVVHPLIKGALPLSLCLQTKGAFISGQNGIGKSTLLRAIGLNLVVARAFGFCYARKAKVPICPVFTSMQNEDSLLGGESLYIAELRRAKELLMVSKSSTKCVFIIDEIFRGTNHVESISAAAAVLHSLAEKAMVIVSSHNLVLSTLLSDCLTSFCVSAHVHENRQLTLLPGVLSNPNGIALLSAHGFGDSIESKATRVFDWLNGYLVHPTSYVDVLDSLI